MINFTFERFELSTATPFEARAFAERNFAHAKIIALGGLPAAKNFAREWFDFYQPGFWEAANEVKRQRLVEQSATDALAAAHKIVEDGRACYLHDAGDQIILVACSLIPDASAGPTGYFPLMSRSPERADELTCNA